MVFGWGKKKTHDKRQTIQEKSISITEIKPIIEDIQSIQTKTVISEAKISRKKIEEKLNEIQLIINELEHDDLNVDNIDKHLELIVVRGKKQVIDIIKKEVLEPLPELKTFDDVKSLNEVVEQSLKRIGDVLGRQSRIIHIFAKKYASKLKDHLAVLNSTRSELQTLIDKHSNLNANVTTISEKIHTFEETKRFLEESNTRITELQKNIENSKDTKDSTRQKISSLKSGSEFTKYLETQKKLDSLSSTKNQIKNSLAVQFTKISRPLNRYGYVSALEKHQKILLEKLIANPFDVLILQNRDDIIKILSSVRKGIESGSISVKDFEKSLANIDETIESLDGFIHQITEFNKKKNLLEKELDAFNTRELKQNESRLTKIDTDISDTESKLEKLRSEISENNTKLLQLVKDLENRVYQVSSIRYKIKQ